MVKLRSGRGSEAPFFWHVVHCIDHHASWGRKWTNLLDPSMSGYTYCLLASLFDLVSNNVNLNSYGVPGVHAAVNILRKDGAKVDREKESVARGRSYDLHI